MIDETALRATLHDDAPALALDAAFTDGLETQLRDAAAAAPIAELGINAPRRSGRRTALIAVAIAAVITIVIAIAVARTHRNATPAYPIDQLRYRAVGVFYTDGTSTTYDDSIVDPLSGATSLFSQTPRPTKDGGTRVDSRVHAGGISYEATTDWVGSHGWPSAARLRLLRGKDWVGEGPGTSPGTAFADLPVRWQHQHLSGDPRVHRLGTARIRGITSTRYRVDDPRATNTAPLDVWVDAANRVLRAQWDVDDNVQLVFDYTDFGSAPPVPVPDPRTVVSSRVLDDPTLCNQQPLHSDLVTSCRVHPGIATSGYRYTQTWHQVALDHGFVPVTSRMQGTVDGTHMNAEVTTTGSDRPGVTDTGEIVDGKRYGNGITWAQMTFSLDALTDSSPFIGTFDVLNGLRGTGLSPKQVGHETIRDIETTHYRATHTVGPYDTSGAIGEHITFDVWVDIHRRVARMVVTTDVPGDSRTPQVHPQHDANTFDFYNYGLHPTITPPKATHTAR